jgi:glycosyltransferase involved in cell wall biosynthesis
MSRLKGVLTDPVLSVVMPVYNERDTIEEILTRVAAVPVRKEVIVVDDCSTDGTGEIAARFAGVRVHRQPHNQGKGAAVRAGMALATGDYLIIQDADLEYDPQDYLPMLRALLGGAGDIVYGSRYSGADGRGGLGAHKHPAQSWAAYLGGRSLSFFAWAFTGQYLTDTVTALKLFPREDLVSLELRTSGFELDHEITAKMVARGRRIVEVPIKYFPRSRAEGKKIGMKDWFRGVRTFWRYRKG